MFKISLINPPERILEGTVRYYLPFSLLYLAAYLEGHGIGTDIIDIKTEDSWLQAVKKRIADYYNSIFKKQGLAQDRLYSLTMDKIIREALASRADLIGISCMTREYESVMKMASLLKERSATPVVIGGIHPSLYPEQFIYDKSPVDFVVIGEGEETLLELARCLESGSRDYEFIDGIAYLKDNKCHSTRQRAVNYDFSASPVKIYDQLNMDFYTRPHPYVTRHVRVSGVQIFTSRGCPYNCTFCSNPAIRRMNKIENCVRHRPLERVIEEIKYLRDKYHIDAFYIMDDTFCIDKRHAEEFCRQLKDAGINLAWGIETRANLVDEPLLKIMQEAGLVQIDVGVESGSDRMLKEIKKGITVADIRNIFSLAHKHKIRAFASFIINLPGETCQELQETLDLLEEIRPDAGVIGTTIPLPKTELFDKYLSHKITSDWEIVELLGRRLNYYRAKDKRFHFCSYDVDFEAFIDRLILRHFPFAELELGAWYWKVFFRSRRKIQYIVSIMHGALAIIERIISSFPLKKQIIPKPESVKAEDISAQL